MCMTPALDSIPTKTLNARDGNMKFRLKLKFWEGLWAGQMMDTADRRRPYLSVSLDGPLLYHSAYSQTALLRSQDHTQQWPSGNGLVNFNNSLAWSWVNIFDSLQQKGSDWTICVQGHTSFSYNIKANIYWVYGVRKGLCQAFTCIKSSSSHNNSLR